MAYVLKLEKQVQIIKMLVEGTSIRSVERITGVHRDTIIRLMLRVAKHCSRILDERLRGLTVQYIQCDEIWAFVAKKERRTTFDDHPDFGDAYTYVAFDQDSKLAITHLVGKRDERHTSAFIADLASRVVGRVQITTDGWAAYPPSVKNSFGTRVAYGQIVKAYKGDGTDGQHRYSPPRIAAIRRCGFWGRPRMRFISTSHVERQNLTMRMQMRRFTRLTNGFSKKLPNLRAAVALHFAWYNFVRIHRSLGMTPAMSAGVVSNLWTIEDLMTGGHK